MLQEISDFIKKNKVATICCISKDSAPYCFNCMYTFQENINLLLFKSSAGSYHSKLLSENHRVAGTILPSKLELLSIKGIQFSGIILYDPFPDEIRPEVNYHKAYPFAITKQGHVWCVQLEMVKMTDNSQVFGKKIQWCRSDKQLS